MRELKTAKGSKDEITAAVTELLALKKEYKTVTGKELPHQSHAQYARVKRITRANAKPGDLVFFFGGGAHHVGIYIGNGKMVDAAGYGKGVRVSPISGSWWSRTYSGIGRILPA